MGLSKKYFNLAANISFEAIQNSRQFEFSRVQQMSIVKFLLAKKSEPSEIYIRLSNVYW